MKRKAQPFGPSEHPDQFTHNSLSKTCHQPIQTLASTPSTSGQHLGTMFYIQYKSCPPMAIHTHFRIDEETEHLETVRDLITAYQMSDGSPLANVSPDYMTVRLPCGILRRETDINYQYFTCYHPRLEDSSLTPNCPLTVLGAFGQSPDSPLVIKKKDEMFEFDPLLYKPEDLFPKQDRSRELTLISRDDVVKQINDITLDDTNTTFKPIIMCTSRGMGKTFVVKKLALQHVKPHLKNIKIQFAGECGRIIWYKFSRVYFENFEQVDKFLTRLMILTLSERFEQSSVDGINFEPLSYLNQADTYIGKQEKFTRWLRTWANASVDDMMDEYIRLTNIAFKIDPNSYKGKVPPVFLFEGVQSACHELELDGKKDTSLRYILDKLCGRHHPICICTGTFDGHLQLMSKKSFEPQFITLKPFSISDAMEFWKERVDYYNKKYSASISLYNMNDQEKRELFELIYSTYFIPRFLFTANYEWYFIKFKVRNENIQESFTQEIGDYYPELIRIMDDTGRVGFLDITDTDMVNIILCCATRYKVANTFDCVPNTNIQWWILIVNSIVFPDGDGYYFFPFHLAWNTIEKWMQMRFKTLFAKLIKKVDVERLFLSFNQALSLDRSQTSVLLHELFAAALPIKYYLVNAGEKPQRPTIAFDKLYDFDETPVEFNNVTVSKKMEYSFNVDSLDGRGIINSYTLDLLDLVSTLNSMEDNSKVDEIFNKFMNK